MPGSWTDHGQVIRSGTDAKIVPYNIMNAIDPAIFINSADGKAYLANEDGLVTVVRLGQEPKLLAENDMGQTLLATPAIAGGAIYLRSDKTLFCIGAKKGK